VTGWSGVQAEINAELAGVGIQDLDAELAECENQFVMLEARVRTVLESEIRPDAQDCKDLAVRLENLSAEGLQRACDRNTPGAMDIFEGATAIIDRLAVLQPLLSMGRWGESHTFRLCTNGEENTFQGKAALLDRDAFNSVSKCVIQLNSMQLSGEQKEGVDRTGMCVVFSASYQEYYLLYRSDKQAQAFRDFNKY